MVVRNTREGGTLKTQRSLKSLRLRNANSAVFVPNTEYVRRMLQDVGPFVFFGVANKQMIADFLHKKGMTTVHDSSEKKQLDDKEEEKEEWEEEEEKKEWEEEEEEEGKQENVRRSRKKIVPLSNRIVEDYLGEVGLICVEDLVDVVAAGKDNELFFKASRMVLPFRVNDITRADSMVKWKWIRHGFLKDINSFIAKLM